MKKNIQQPTPANPCQPLQVKFNVEKLTDQTTSQ